MEQSTHITPERAAGQSHIIVTGGHRSGTTLVGHVLAQSQRALYVHEPLSPKHPNPLVGPCATFWYEDLSHSPNRAKLLKAMDGLLGAGPFRQAALVCKRSHTGPSQLARFVKYTALGFVGRGVRIVMKDPFALLSLEELSERYRVAIVCAIRSPRGFVASLKKSGWGFAFTDFTGQPAVMDALPPALRENVSSAAKTSLQPAACGALLWNVLHHFVSGYMDRHPEWSFLEYERLAANPEQEFAWLHRQLALPFTTAQRAYCRELTSGGGEPAPGDPFLYPRDAASCADAWKQRLSDDEVAAVDVQTGELWERIQGLLRQARNVGPGQTEGAPPITALRSA